MQTLTGNKRVLWQNYDAKILHFFGGKSPQFAFDRVVLKYQFWWQMTNYDVLYFWHQPAVQSAGELGQFKSLSWILSEFDSYLIKVRMYDLL